MGWGGYVGWSGERGTVEEKEEENGFNSIPQCASTSEPHRTVEDPVNTPRSHLSIQRLPTVLSKLRSKRPDWSTLHDTISDGLCSVEIVALTTLNGLCSVEIVALTT